jgi:hypothetical protein
VPSNVPPDRWSSRVRLSTDIRLYESAADQGRPPGRDPSSMARPGRCLPRRRATLGSRLRGAAAVASDSCGRRTQHHRSEGSAGTMAPGVPRRVPVNAATPVLRMGASPVNASSPNNSHRSSALPSGAISPAPSAPSLRPRRGADSRRLASKRASPPEARAALPPGGRGRRGAPAAPESRVGRHVKSAPLECLSAPAPPWRRGPYPLFRGIVAHPAP